MSFLKKVFRPVTRLIRSVGREIRRWITPDLPGKESLKLQREGSDFYIPIQYGRGVLPAIIVDKNSSTDKKLLYVLAVFCVGEIESFERFEIDGYDENDERFNKDGGGKWFSYETRLGSDTQTPMNGSGKLNRWSSTNSHYRGLAVALFTFEMDKDQQLWRGTPQIRAFVKGRKVYDPRIDAVVYTENGALHALDYARNTRFGMAISDSEINEATFIAAANICETEEGGNTVTRQVCEWIPDEDPTAPPIYICRTESTTTKSFKRFTHNNLIDTEQKTTSNLQEIVNSFRGFFPDVDGRLAVGVEIEGDPVFDFHEGNIISDIKSESGDIDERYNRVTVRFNNVENEFDRDEVTFPAPDSQLYADWLAEDNGLPLEHTINADHIIYKAEALQLAELSAYVSRNTETVGFTGDYETIQVDVGDIVTVSDEDRGWDKRLFRVSKLANKEDGTTDFTLVQHDDGLYPWSPVDYSEIIGGSNLADPRRPEAPTNLQFFPDTTLATTGELQWVEPAGQFTRQYEVIVETNGERVREFMTTATKATIPLLDVGDYALKVRTISSLGAYSQFASILLELRQPVPPTDLGLSSSNNTVTSEPVLAGSGLGTSFEFDIDDLSDSEFEPEPRLRGRSAVFTGRLPQTLYRVWARTINALGESAWVSDNITTTGDVAEQRPIVEQLLDDPSITGPVTQEVFERTERARQRVADARVSIIEEATNSLKVAREKRERVAAIKVERLARETGFIEVREDLSTETEQRVLQINGIVATLDDEIANRQAAILNVQEAIADEASARATEINSVNARIDTAEGEIEANSTLIQDAFVDIDGNAQAIAGLSARVTDVETESGATAQLVLDAELSADGSTKATVALDARLDTAEDEIQANATLIQNVTNDVDGNTTAISGLESAVFDPVSGLGAISSLVLASGLDENGNTTATAGLDARLDDAEQELLTQAQLILDVEQKADGNTSAIAALDARVEDGEEFASAQLILNSEFDEELGTLSARAFLGTDVNGRVTGVVIDDDGITRTIEFSGDVVRFLRANGTSAIVYDTNLNEFVFDGRVTAETVEGIELVGNSIIVGSSTVAENNNTGYFTHTQATPFGTANDLAEWYGEKVAGVTWNTSTQRAIPSGMSKINAKTYKTVGGDVFFGGSFVAGTISTSAATTSLANSGDASVMFTSNGNELNVAASYNWQLQQSHTQTTCPATPPDPIRTGTLVLEELVGSTWTQRRSEAISGTFNCIPAIDEGGEIIPGIYTWSASRSFTFSAAQISGVRRFRVRFFGMQGGGSIAGSFSVTQSASIVTSEE